MICDIYLSYILFKHIPNHIPTMFNGQRQERTGTDNNYVSTIHCNAIIKKNTKSRRAHK